MDHKIKMIAFDLDGTLLTTEKKLTDRTRKALVEAAEKGIHLVPTTGRSLGGIPKELIDFPGVRYIITANGARVLDVTDGSVIVEELLAHEKCEKILEIFEKYDTLIEIYYDGIGYAEREKLEKIHLYQENPAMQRYICNTRKSVESVRAKFAEENRDMDKIQALFHHIEDKRKAWEEIEAAVSDIEITGALLSNVEINAQGIHKGNAIVALGELLQITKDEIMAFGDGKNDIQMLQTAGIGVAMANSVEEVIAAADMVTASNDEDGVAKTIEQYVLS